MQELIDRLRRLQANAFIYYTKAHGYHWDVEGILFEQFHSMFGDLYEDVWGSVDEYAEWLRRLGEKASFSVMSALANSSIKYDLESSESNPIVMLQSLLNSNNLMLGELKISFDYATNAKEEGLANYIAERIDAHQKWGWRLSASLKSMIVS